MEEPAGRPGSTLQIVDIVCASDVSNAGEISTEDLEWLRAHADRAAAHLGASGAVRVKLIGDDEMAAAHLEYCDVPGTTDVITFDLRDDDRDANTLDADLLVCVDEAHRQAAERGHAVQHELLLYVVHGVLHCLGEDDRDDASWQQMHEREDAVLTAIGVGAVFDRAKAAADGGGS